MNGNLPAKLLAQMRCIACVVAVAVHDDDEQEVPVSATCILQFFVDIGSPFGISSIDEDEAGHGIDEIAVNKTEAVKD